MLLKRSHFEVWCCLKTLSSIYACVVPKKWFVVDYILENHETQNPQAIKQGANICFLTCAVFKERSRIRAMTYHDYEKMGIGLFSHFCYQTGAKIGYYMSRKYKIMVGVTDECMRTI